MTLYKPQNYPTISPYLIVNGADRTIEFLVEVFGAALLRRFSTEDGKLMHAEVRVGDSVVMLGDSAEGWPPVPAHVHVYVPNVDATFKRALEAGATAVQEPSRREGDDDRRGGVKDASGVTWWIATKVG